MSRMIKPLISAWVGRGNFGDELLAYGLRLELYKAGQVSSVSYYEKGSYDIFRTDRDVKIRYLIGSDFGRLRKFLNKGFQRYGSYDKLIFGGGSIFHSINSIEWKHDLLKRFHKNRFLKEVSKAGCVGVSLGPFNTSTAENAAISYIKDLDFLHCRDTATADFAHSNTSSLQILRGRDLAFSVRAIQPEIFQSPKVKERVGVSFLLESTLSSSERAEVFNKMVFVVNKLVKQGYSVILISLYCGKEHRDDILHRNIDDHVNNPGKVSVHHYRGDVVETLKCIASCDFYISMRLHGIIAAFLAETPALALHDNKKIIDINSDLYGSTEPLGINNINVTADYLWARVEDFIKNSKQLTPYSVLNDCVYSSSSKELMNIFANKN